MTNSTSVRFNLINPTPSKARDLRFGIALSQTVYELNNGYGVQTGKPLVFLEDSALINTQGAKPLKVSIPEGFIVEGSFTDSKTGLDAILAFNKSTGEIVIGLAGTNGFGNDAPDTKQDVVVLGVGQAKALYDNDQFQNKLEEIKKSLLESGVPIRVLIAGQSLGGGVATTLGLLLAYGDPSLSDPLRANRLKLRTYPDRA